jgi:hypothetical protein
MARSQVILVTAVQGARGSEALAAGVATCAADDRRTALVVELGAAARPRRPTLLASPAAREAEARLGGTSERAAARGLICHLCAGVGLEGLDQAAWAAQRLGGPCVLHLEPELWQEALQRAELPPCGALLRAELPRDRALAALAVRELRSRGMAVRIARRPLGWSAARRALAGIGIGGADEARLRRWTAALLGVKEASAAADDPMSLIRR